MLLKICFAIGFVVFLCAPMIFRFLLSLVPGGRHEFARLPAPVKFLRANKNESGRVLAKPLLTGNELEFWHRLENALPDFSVLPQVAMGALLQNRRSGDWETIRQYQGKICDYVLVKRRTARVVAVVELDDVTHDVQADFRRDQLMSAAGIATLRFHSRSKPKAPEIRAALGLVG
jgi:hypothetical protein